MVGNALLNWDVALQVLKYVKQLKDCGDLPKVLNNLEHQ
jgi:hypothetical protein